MNGGSEQQFLAQLPLILGIPQIPLMSSKIARKIYDLQYETDFGDYGIPFGGGFPFLDPNN